MYRFGKHANVIIEKVRKRNNMLSALAGSTWGKYKEGASSRYLQSYWSRSHELCSTRVVAWVGRISLAITLALSECSPQKCDRMPEDDYAGRPT